MAIKKSMAVWLGAIYDSQATNRKQRELPVRAPPPAALLLVTWESYMTPSWPEYTKTPLLAGGSSYFLIENCLKQHFYIKAFNKI